MKSLAFPKTWHWHLHKAVVHFTFHKFWMLLQQEELFRCWKRPIPSFHLQIIGAFQLLQKVPHQFKIFLLKLSHLPAANSRRVIYKNRFFKGNTYKITTHLRLPGWALPITRTPIFLNLIIIVLPVRHLYGEQISPLFTDVCLKWFSLIRSVDSRRLPTFCKMD